MKYLWGADRITGALVVLKAEGLMEVQACTLSVFRDKLDVENKQVGMKNVLHFSKQYPPGLMALCITGKGVMTRRIDQPGAPFASILQTILPNSNPDEFYVQFHQDQQEQQYISLIRRAEADQLVAEFESYLFKVVSLSLGGFASSGVLRPEGMDEGLVPAYETAFQALLLPDQAVEAEAPAIKYSRAQAFARVKLLRTARLGGLLVAVLLVLNSLIRPYYSEKADRLTAENKLSGAAVGQLRETEAAILKKSRLIAAVGWTAGLHPAFVTDQLCSLMPAGITIREFLINPLKKDSDRDGRSRLYQQGMVQISGACQQAGTLNSWLIAIKTLRWVKEGEIKSYQVSQDTGLGSFVVHIHLKEDGK